MRRKKCPYCRGEISIFHDHEVGDEVYCEECEQEFEILSINPIRLGPLESYSYYEEEALSSYEEFYDN